MKAGRELDALVAEKVMGAKILKRFMSAGYQMFELDKSLAHPCCPAMEDRMDRGSWFDVPDYSTELIPAWEVLEKLSEDGLDVQVRRVHPQNNPQHLEWYCEVNSQKETAMYYADSAPLAICLAALKFKGVQL